MNAFTKNQQNMIFLFPSLFTQNILINIYRILLFYFFSSYLISIFFFSSSHLFVFVSFYFFSFSTSTTSLLLIIYFLTFTFFIFLLILFLLFFPLSYIILLKDNNANPVWDESFFLYVKDPSSAVLSLRVMDKDLFKEDGVMGLGVISVKELQVNIAYLIPLITTMTQMTILIMIILLITILIFMLILILILKLMIIVTMILILQIIRKNGRAGLLNYSNGLI